MVVFTCNNCGDSLQKPRVAKHLQFSCRRPASLTCVDCHKDFRGDEYVAHTKCITEAERYGGKNYVPKPGANKGEQKQQQWLNVVNNLLNNSTNLSPLERSLLEKISKFENVPRKKAKFLNFINTMGHRVNNAVVESVWAKMEAAQIKPAQNGIKSSDSVNSGGHKHEESLRNSISEDRKENNIAENENNENISRESKSDEYQNKKKKLDNNENGISDTKLAKKKKSRKRELSESSKDLNDETSPKKKTEIASNENSQSVEDNICDHQTKNSAFDWKNAICTVVSKKQEISLHKLQKKIVARYINYCSDAVSHENAVSKFNKKLKKISEIVVADEIVRLS